MASTPSIPKGTRDFSTEVILKRDYIFDTIKQVFRLYGYQPIETPAMENLTTLLGKYGEEGDRLVYRILNSGDFIENYESKDIKKLEETWKQLLVKMSKNDFSFKKFLEIVQSYQQKNDRISEVMYKYLKSTLAQVESYCKKNEIKDGPSFIRYLEQYRYPHLVKKLKGFILTKAELMKGITEKGLRYDLTVPFARYVVQHQNEIIFPFKRYQIQPVWRGENTQKGRYREFYQCDVDIIGSDSMLNEVELIKIIDEIFGKLNIAVQIKINNRKILSGIAEYAGVPDRITDITVALDKYEKIGWEKVKEELISKGINKSIIKEFGNIIGVVNKDNNEKVKFLNSILLDSIIGTKGIQELSMLLDLLENVKLTSNIDFDLTLARGLNYYTGAIIEIRSKDINIGSICGGGRYDNLTGVFGLKGMSGVGISFGADRIYDVLTHLNGFSKIKKHGTSIMILNSGEGNFNFNLRILEKLHRSGISGEIFPDPVEIWKQTSYANSKNISYVLMAGEDEIKHNKVTVKNMLTGEQKKIGIDELPSFFN